MHHPLLTSLALTGVYLFVVHRLRYSRIRRVHEAYAARHGLKVPPTFTHLPQDSNRSLKRAHLPMTAREAQEIILPGFLYDFPFLAGHALEFALFKTYGIPSISKLLASTTEFVQSDKSGKRYVDTALLILSWVVYPLEGPGSGVKINVDSSPVDPRGAIAIARTNYIHSRYAGKISNDDFLYTLSTFCFEVGVWCEQFAWRPLTPLEEMAWFVFFSEIGRRMGIQDIPDELDDFKNWAEAYEKAEMVPATDCHVVAEGTIKLLLHNIPQPLHPFGEFVVSTLLYDRLREAILLPAPPIWLKITINSTLKISAWFVKHFCLPRWHPKRLVPLPEDEAAFPKGFIRKAETKEEVKDEEIYAPKSHPVGFENEPWYIAEPKGVYYLYQRFLLLLRLMRHNQIPGPSYRPEGYRLEHCGPTNYESKGAEEVKRMAEAIQGCPLEGPYAVGGVHVSQCPFKRA